MQMAMLLSMPSNGSPSEDRKPMTRSTRLSIARGFWLFVGIASILCPTREAAAEKRPNVLFIAVDDLRPLLGCYQQDQIRSPNIDALAKRGTVFKRAYCQIAVCGASRASLLTGMRPTPTRFLNYKTYADTDVPNAMTLPQEFKANGYHCISNGKIFHHRNDTANRSWSEAPWKPTMGGASPLAPSSKNLRGGTKNRGPIFESPNVPDNAYPDGQIAEKTIRDIQRMHREGKTFFVACGFLKPHLPFYAPKKYWEMYDYGDLKVAENQFKPTNAPKSLRGSEEIKNYHDRGIEYNSEQWHRSCRHGYFACVSYVDAQIGKLLNILEELEIRQDTIVVLWGDHGFHLGEHNFWGKHNVMHLATRSPLIVSAPKFKAANCDRLVEFVDIYPSLCELAGISTSNDALQGTSFVPLLSSPDRPWKKAAFSKYGNAISVITERYNYAEFVNGEKLLFDLTQDAAENVNLSSDVKHQETVTELSQLLSLGHEQATPSRVPTPASRPLK